MLPSPTPVRPISQTGVLPESPLDPGGPRPCREPRSLVWRKRRFRNCDCQSRPATAGPVRTLVFGAQPAHEHCGRLPSNSRLTQTPGMTESELVSDGKSESKPRFDSPRTACRRMPTNRQTGIRRLASPGDSGTAPTPYLYPQRQAHPANDQCPSPRVSNGGMLKFDCQIHLRDSMDVKSTRCQPSVVLWRRRKNFGRPAKKQTLSGPIRVVSFSVPIRGLPTVANNPDGQTREEGRTPTPHATFADRFPRSSHQGQPGIEGCTRPTAGADHAGITKGPAPTGIGTLCD
jgi:hypothetical protein